MTFFALSLMAYSVFCISFVAYTFREGQLSGEGWDAHRVLGLVACLVWPVVLTGVAIAVIRDRRLRYASLRTS